MEDKPLKDMSTRELRDHVTARLMDLSEWDPDNEVSAVAAIDVLRRHLVRCSAGVLVVLGRVIDEHPDI